MRLEHLKRFVCIASLSALPLLAAEGKGGEAEGPAMIWKVLNFLILAGLLGYLIGKNLGPALTARAKGILDSLEAGEKAKKEAELRAAAVQAKLANLEKEIAAMRDGARAERDREAERLRKDAQTDMARIRAQAEMEIESAGKQARLELQRYAAKLALDLAEQKVRSRMSPEVQSGLFAGFLANIEDTARVTRAS